MKHCAKSYALYTYTSVRQIVWWLLVVVVQIYHSLLKPWAEIMYSQNPKFSSSVFLMTWRHLLDVCNKKGGAISIISTRWHCCPQEDFPAVTAYPRSVWSYLEEKYRLKRTEMCLFSQSTHQPFVTSEKNRVLLPALWPHPCQLEVI